MNSKRNLGTPWQPTRAPSILLAGTVGECLMVAGAMRFSEAAKSCTWNPRTLMPLTSREAAYPLGYQVCQWPDPHRRASCLLEDNLTLTYPLFCAICAIRVLQTLLKSA